MSVNDPDGEPYPVLTKEEFMRILTVEDCWAVEAAEREWEEFSEGGTKPVRLCDLEW